MAPEPERIEVIGGSRVEITWDDGAVTAYTAPELRAACMCAGCREAAGAAATRAVLAGATPVTITEAALVGGYALRFVFGPDGHGTGIYPFEKLLSMVVDD